MKILISSNKANRLNAKFTGLSTKEITARVNLSQELDHVIPGINTTKTTEVTY